MEKRDTDEVRDIEEVGNLRVKATAIATQGTPDYMEDMTRTETLKCIKWGLICLCLVADGHGSHEVSTMLKNNVFERYQTKFALLDDESIDATVENLDQIMIPVLRNLNKDLQNEIEEQNLEGGSTLVAAFTFIKFQRLYVLNVGDSRFQMFETESGNMVHNVSRIIDLEDGLERTFSVENLHPCRTILQKIRGPIEFRNNCTEETRKEVIRCKEMTGEWSLDFLQHMSMKNDTPDRHGVREWALWLQNEETNPRQALQLVSRRTDKQFVVGKKGRLNITRAFGDIGYAMHMGEIYVADIPTDKEVAFLLCSDGLEETMDCEDMRKFICHPKTSLENLLIPKDNKIRQMSEEYKSYFVKKGIGAYPEGEDAVQIIKWIKRFLKKMGRTHLPDGEKNIPAIQGACSYLEWAYGKYSRLSEENTENKFYQDFHDSLKFRLQVAIQTALCRFSFDNISGVLVSFQKTNESNI